jgi:uncharacterized protein YbjT (DUF2867 family)
VQEAPDELWIHDDLSPGDPASPGGRYPRDVAAVAAAILEGAGHEDQTYVLTGPEALTYNEIAETLTAVLGRPIEFVPVSDQVAHEAFLRAGVPDWGADALVSVFQRLREGVQDVTTDVVRRLTEREPRTIAEYLRDHVHVFQNETPAHVAHR